ncbi:tetratricopeptide repeat protein [Sulfurimonas aquatica]|uniref:Tetratricopeptide repeat protein n=1 Tax=Sulfurimonas aquatica TaxID=2672570 RepID=A0A975GDC0_9BACT|nr:tetratricopeptide repeat protein [Sulfurimonas aquatica]QSZ42576.1 tetratricopeptide repeat protein [Sulfurimonas aquatica]
MADLEEEIIIIEDSEAAENLHPTEEKVEESLDSSKKKKIIIFAALGLLLILIIILTIVLLSKSPQKVIPLDMDLLDEKLENQTEEKIEPSKLENMIAKANYLYTNGSKEKALSLYENIAHYSEAISEYNLGVAQLKNEQYALALKTFTRAIKNDEKRCVSAINAAVCSLHLKDQESFKYYIDLAYAYLPYEVNSPLYSYYYTLISYYNQDYINALNSLKNATSNEYETTQKNLAARINALYGNDYEAIDIIEKNNEHLDDFSLGLLYARIGDFALANNHFDEAIIKNIQPVKAQLALALISLKSGQLKRSASKIKNVTDMYPEEVYEHYPIKVKLKDSLFDTQKAQKLYRDKIIHSKSTIFQKIFTFSPYKVFNANKTISYIRKGNANIYIDNIQAAKEYLKTSSSSSNVNIGITRAIKKALNLQIREANLDLQELIKIQPKHSILHYNLALTYAQMGDNKKAHEHFLRSYYLDAKNYLSGVYAVMTSQLIHKESKKLKSILIDSITSEEASEEKELYKTLLYISENNYVSAIEWLDNDYKQRPLYLTLNTIIALKLNRLDIAKQATNKLTVLLPNDILPHLMYIDTHFSEYKPKEYANEVLNYLKKQDFNFNDLYHGPYITRYLYIQENLITGKLYFLREQLKKVLQTTDTNTHEIESALALASLYDKQFEESYTLYNHIIDDLQVRDSYTLFMGAVASTAAGHHENAIALLELSKLKDSDFFESRYALALLYLEVKNNAGAVIQLSRIEEDGFISQYFDFSINTNELLFKKQHPKE